MAYYSNTQILTALNDVLDTDFDMEGVQQFTRLGATSRLINTRKVKFKGKAHHYIAFVQPGSGIRVKNFTDARTGEFPVARDSGFFRQSVLLEDLRMYQGTAKINDMDRLQTEDLDMSVVELAEHVMGQVTQDLPSKFNASLFQSGTCSMFTVKAIYDVDGSSFTGGAGHAAAYISIQGGSVAQANVGDILEIYGSDSVSGADQRNHLVKVLAVNPSQDGPHWAGTRVPSIGPGLIVEPCSADGSTTAGTEYAYAWQTKMGDGSADTPASGDFIARDDEFTKLSTGQNNIHGFPDFFNPLIPISRNEAGTLVVRTEPANHWLIPEIVDPAKGGAMVEFDPAIHLKDLELVMPMRMQTSRLGRRGQSDAPKLMNSITLIGDPAIIRQAVTTAGGAEMFTSTIKMNADSVKDLFGETGWDGLVYHSSTLGHIGFQADPAMIPNTLYLIDPNSFAWITFGGDPGKLTWLQGDTSGRWSRLKGDTNGTATFYQQAHAYSMACLICDCPQVNAVINNVTVAA